jgi:hypothetical protein
MERTFVTMERMVSGMLRILTGEEVLKTNRK